MSKERHCRNCKYYDEHYQGWRKFREFSETGWCLYPKAGYINGKPGTHKEAATYRGLWCFKHEYKTQLTFDFTKQEEKNSELD